MRGVRIPYDLNGRDRFVLGLSVTSLAGLLFGLLTAYTILHLHMALVLRLVLAGMVAAAAAALAWLRPEGRSLIHWLVAAIEYKFGTELQSRLPESEKRTRPQLAILNAASDSADDAALEGSDRDIVELPANDSRHQEPTDDPGDAAPVPVYMGGPQVIAFFSAKGGTGRTTLATEVGCLLAQKGRYRESPIGKPKPLRIILADFDCLSANVSVRLGLVQPTILDYLTDTTRPARQVHDYVRKHSSSGLEVLLGPPKCLPPNVSSLLNVSEALSVLSALRADGYHFIFLDLGSSLGELECSLLQETDRIYCVVNPTASSIQDLYRGVEILRRLGFGPKLRYVANRVRQAHDFSEPMGDLGGILAAQVPFDAAFDSSENRHQPLVLQGTSDSAKAIWRLATSVYPALGYPAAAAPFSPLNWFARRRHAS